MGLSEEEILKNLLALNLERSGGTGENKLGPGFDFGRKRLTVG
jgi:hypothetical protein